MARGKGKKMGKKEWARDNKQEIMEQEAMSQEETIKGSNQEVIIGRQ